jgi:Tol biopolymer transport system component
VVPDVSSGPAWLPDGKRIAYVRNDKQDYSPIYVVDVNTRKGSRLETGTSINHDLSVSSNGIIAFRAQVEQWDQIFLVKLPEVAE